MILRKALLVLSFLVILSQSETITIKASRALANVNNDTVTVEGQITALPGAFQDYGNKDNGVGFSIQDATSGILVYVEEDSFYEGTTLLDDLVLGTTVTVSGTIDTSEGPTIGNDNGGGHVRIKPSAAGDIVVGATGDEVEPRVINPDQVEDYQGELVQIQDVNISSVIKISKYGADYMAEDEDGLFTSIYVYYLWGNRSNEYPILGQQYEYITGVASVFYHKSDNENEWEIWPRDEDDFKKVGSSSERRAVYTCYSQWIVTIMLIYQFI
eukprot:12578_1